MGDKAGFKRFVFLRAAIAIVIIAAIVWSLGIGLEYVEQYFGPKSTTASGETTKEEGAATIHDHPAPGTPADVAHDDVSGEGSTAPASATDTTSTGEHMSAMNQELQSDVESMQEARPTEPPAQPPEETPAHGLPQETATPRPLSQGSKQPVAAAPADQAHETAAPSAPPAKVAEPATTHAAPLPTGVTFVTAIIEPLEYELRERWWGWRPNDIINVTDNVNNFQLGVLEVTRRAAVQLAERISRTGSTDAFNKHLENAMNWLMIKADQYWFPTPESKYKESLEEMAVYREQLMNNAASFYTRTDNIIPLLAAFEDLLGSCDENLVKNREKDGSKVGYFSIDNYFYYAKGIASAMATILEAMHTDFMDTLEKRNGGELLHHAVESCKRAASLSPWLITEGDLDGFLANHRANMAAPISHARFYLGQLIKTLST